MNSPPEGKYPLPVIDLHTHIVPAVDDGVRTPAEANRILDRMAVETGSLVVFTPHFSVDMPQIAFDARRNMSLGFISQMEKRYREKLGFLLAGELMLRFFSLSYLQETRYPGTGWVLVEFAVGVSWFETLFHLKRIIRRGYYPLIAHPERYRWCRQNQKRLVYLSRMGCGILVSARSFSYTKFAETAGKLLQKGLSHALCSDAHSEQDSLLDHQLRSSLQKSFDIPWRSLTFDMPNMILNDMRLPVLPICVSGDAQ